MLDDPVGYIAGGGQNNQILFGVLLELLLIIANIGTAVVIFPIVRRQNEELALGYVTARLLECTFILVGIVAVLGIVTLQQDVAGAAEGTLAYTLAAIKDWTFLLWTGLGRRLGQRADPRLPHVQLGPRAAKDDSGLVSSADRSLFCPAHSSCSASQTPVEALQGIATIPEGLWELLLGVYCAVKGFRPSAPILQAAAARDRMEARPAVTPA